MFAIFFYNVSGKKKAQLVCYWKTGTSRSSKKKGEVSVLKKRTNACGRHKNGSKLETMRLRISQNWAGGGAEGFGGA